MRRAHEHRMRRSRQRQVVAVTTLAGQQPSVFLAPDRLADAAAHGGRSVHPPASSHAGPAVVAAAPFKDGSLGVDRRRQQTGAARGATRPVETPRASTARGPVLNAIVRCRCPLLLARACRSAWSVLRAPAGAVRWMAPLSRRPAAWQSTAQKTGCC